MTPVLQEKITELLIRLHCEQKQLTLIIKYIAREFNYQDFLRNISII